jgi:Nif-specific regulatory protein
MNEKDPLKKKNLELAAILEVSRVLTSSFDLEENLTSVMKILGAHLEMQRGCVFLLDPVTKDLGIVAAHGLTKDEIRRGKYRIGEGIVGMVMESGSPMFVPDIGDEPKFLNRTGSRPKKEGVSFLSIPIGLKGEVSGVISVDRIYSKERGGVDDDLRVLTIVSSLIAQFVKLWENFKKSEEEKESLRMQLKEKYSLPNIVGESERFHAVLKAVKKVAGTDASVLLLGESGTGKELIARTIHFQSRGAKGPFVAVNCAAIPENLLEAELFGAEKGAFTGAVSRRTGRFESARGGTIFLDEIAELPMHLQPKLLRVLQERTFEPLGSSRSVKADARVIAATNRDLEKEVREGRFREDLYWRLNVVPVMLPPLRERKSDIPILINHYMGKFNSTYGKNIKVSEDAMNAFVSYSWPGNVRELANALERLVIMSDSDLITKNDLPYNMPGKETAPMKAEGRKEEGMPNLPLEVEMLERARIIRSLKEHGLIQHKAASALGMTQRQLGYRIKKYNIDIGGLR